VNTKSKVSPDQNNNSQTDVTHKETVVCRTSDRQKRVPITRNNDFFMETVTADSQKSLIPQQSKEGSPNQIKESNLKVNLNTKNNDVKNKQSCRTKERKPLNSVEFISSF
jgi:hypothetical protein